MCVVPHLVITHSAVHSLVPSFRISPPSEQPHQFQQLSHKLQLKSSFPSLSGTPQSPFPALFHAAIFVFICCHNVLSEFSLSPSHVFPALSPLRACYVSSSHRKCSPAYTLEHSTYPYGLDECKKLWLARSTYSMYSRTPFLLKAKSISYPSIEWSFLVVGEIFCCCSILVMFVFSDYHRMLYSICH